MNVTKCSRCGITKSVDDFPKDKRCRGGFSRRCRPCVSIMHKEWRTKNKDKVLKAGSEWREANPTKVTETYRRKTRIRRLMYNFGITEEQYNVLLSSQEGVCAVCRCVCSSGHSLSVDHCHHTGIIRGLLCHKCNVALGLLQDNPDLLRNAIEYLGRYERTPQLR